MKKLLVIVLGLIGVTCVLVSYVYFTKDAGSIPHYFPGYLAGSAHKHVKHGIVFLGLGVVFFLGAWMVSGPMKEAQKSSKE